MKAKKSKIAQVADQIEQAMRDGVRLALEERIRLGVSASIWKDGKVVRVPSNQIWRLLRKL